MDKKTKDKEVKKKRQLEAPIRDYTNYESNSTYKNRHELAPKWPFKLIICGPSGCGKTNLLLNLIHDYLKFIYLYAKMLDEDKYQELQDIFNLMQEKVHEKYGEDFDDLAFFSNSLADVIPVNDLDDNKQNLVVFDDFINEKKQNMIIDYFTMCRKKNCSVIYISHSFYDTPKVIRRNSNYIAYFNFDNQAEISLLKRDFPYKDFDAKYQDVISKPHNFLFIDTKNSDQDLKCRINLDNKIISK